MSSAQVPLPFTQTIKNRSTVAAGGPAARSSAIQRSGASGSEAFQVNLRPATGGQTLPADVQAKMESAFNADFSDVRIHVGREASSVGAIAFTWGSNLHFAPGQYNPHSIQGQQLIGHELAHVVQQRHGRVRNPFGSGVAVVQDRMLEAEADRLGWKAAMTQAPRKAAAVGYQGGSTSSDSATAQTKMLPGQARAALQAKMGRPSTVARQSQGTNAQVLQRRSAVIQMHTGINWGAHGVTAKPSKGGAMGGVMFVTAGNTTHVIKAGKGSASASLFAEEILKSVGGAKHTKSKVVPNNDPEFNEILTVLRTAKQADSGDQEWAPVWEQKMPFFVGADFFLVQRSMIALGGQELKRYVNTSTGQRITGFGQGGFAREDVFANARAILNNDTLLKNIGRILVADGLLGNADRFEYMNMENVFILGNRLGAIDNDAFFSNYAASRMQGLLDERDLNWVQVSGTGSWTQSLIGGERALLSDEEHRQFRGGNHGVDAPPTAQLSNLFDRFDNWFDSFFKSFLMKGTRDYVADREEMKAVSTETWNHAKSKIREGIDDALDSINNMFARGRFAQLKQRFRTHQQTHGDDVNFDLRAFKIRGRYLLARRAGQSNEDALQGAQQHADKYYGLTERIFSWGNQKPSAKTAMSVPDRGAYNKTRHYKNASREGFTACCTYILGIQQEAQSLHDSLVLIMRNARSGHGNVATKAGKKVDYLKQDIAQMGLQKKVDDTRREYERILNEWVQHFSSVQKDKKRAQAARELLSEFKPKAHELSLKLWYLSTDRTF